MPTRTMIEAYLAEAKYRQLSQKTIDGCYRWALSKLEAAFPTSRQNLWRALRTFWRWAAKKELVELAVMESVPSPRSRAKLPRTLSEDELARLLDAPRSLRDTALVAVPLDTGLRLGELASMRRSNIRQRCLIVSGKVGERTVPISAHVRELLSCLGDGDYVWTGRRGPLTASGVSSAIRRMLYEANILPPKAGPHTLRHTFALNYVRRGGDVFSLQRILGHRNVETTMIYVNMSTEHLMEQHAKYSPLADHRFQRSG